MKKLNRFRRALPDRLRDAAEQRARARLGLLVFIAAQEVDGRKDDDLDCETNHEELLIRCRLKAKEGEVRIGATNKVEDVAGGQVSDVHHHVDDGEGHRALFCGGVAARRREQNRRAQRFAMREWENATD